MAYVDVDQVKMFLQLKTTRVEWTAAFSNVFLVVELLDQLWHKGIG